MTLFSFRPAPALTGYIATAVCLLVILAIPVRAQDISTRELGNGLTLISGSGTNILVNQSAGGEVLVVDGGLESHAQQTLDAIADVTDNSDITLLINTHWHPEQTGLNQILGEQGVRIFAHENTRQWLSTRITRPWEDRVFEPMPESARPGDTFYHYGDLNHAGTQVQYGYLRQAHTDGDMYIWFPEANVLHGGGVIANDGWPLMDWWTGGWIGGLANALDILLEIANDDTVIVPASGALMSKADLQVMRDMYDTIFQRISGGFRAANSVEDTLAQDPTAEYNARYGDAEDFVRRSHESLIPHFTPDA
jgi:glyoxylase-like metal-dependent hydrolase (beta-lactamase superfamily II)